MKFMKTICLAVAIVGLAMVTTGPTAASATIFCAQRASQGNLPCVKQYGSNTAFSITMFPGEATIETPIMGRISCKRSTMPGNLSSSGGSTAIIRNSNLTFSECGPPGAPGACSISALEYGSLGVEAVGEPNHQNWGERGTVFGLGQKIQVYCGAFSSAVCVYATTTWTDMGTLSSGSFPAITLKATLKYVAGEEMWCRGASGTATWSGHYEVVSPRPLFVDFA